MSQQEFEPGTNYVAPQPQPIMVPMIQTGEGVVSAIGFNEQSTRGKYLKKMRSLGIAEVVLGGLIVLISVMRAFLTYPALIEVGRCVCGIMIVVSGSLGIATGKFNPSNCMINTRMVFAIIGSFLAGSGFSMSVVTTVYADETFGYASSIIASLIFLFSILVMIFSSGCCCAIYGCCCNSNSAAYIPGSHPVQVVYTHQPTSCPVNQSVYPGYVIQGYQPMQQMQPANTEINQGEVVPQVYSMLDPTFQATPASQQKQQESLSEGQTANISYHPN